MPDKTSDDYLNQPEPVVEETPEPSADFTEAAFRDDPSISTSAVQNLKAHFAAVPPPAQEATSRAQTEVPSLAEFVGDQTTQPQDSTSKLKAELEELKKQLVLLQLTPQERYPKLLDAADITLEEAREILDCLVVQLKPWVETVVVNKFITLEFQTRGQTDVRRMDKWAEKHKPQLDTTVKAEGLMNSMAASLVAYNDHRFDDEDADDEARWKAAYEFLLKMPYPAFRLVQVALGQFDEKINLVFSDGFLENF